MPTVKKLRDVTGAAGAGAELLITCDERSCPDVTANLGNWFLTCPRQALWDSYVLSLIHLRAIAGARAPVITVPGATHELMLLALDPECRPVAMNVDTWRYLRPFNVVEQFSVKTDEDALDLLADAARAVLNGELWAEPPLSNQVEPWRQWVRKRAERSGRCLACGHALWHHADDPVGQRWCRKRIEIEGATRPCACLRFVEKPC
jgi:hypothetical protein